MGLGGSGPTSLFGNPADHSVFSAPNFGAESADERRGFRRPRVLEIVTNEPKLPAPGSRIDLES